MATYTKDEKPLLSTQVTWATILTTWTTEIRQWEDYATFGTYSYDTKAS